MKTLRRRFDAIDAVRRSNMGDFEKAETAAFHGRKVLEGIAFSCLIALDNGIKHVPRDAKGQWSAENILKNLKSKGIYTLPSPSVIRNASIEEFAAHKVKVVVEGLATLRMTHEDLMTAYKDMHRWLHEINPYTEEDHDKFYVKYEAALWRDLQRIRQFVERHFISISGEGFFCVLQDKNDGRTKVMPLSQVAEL